MEAWVIACIVFVFAALMEYTGILLQVLDDADGDIYLVFSPMVVRPRCLWSMLLLQREENGLIRTQRVLVFTMI